MAGIQEIGSMEDLLASVSKIAEQHEAEVPTAGPDSPPTGTSEGNMVEGARSAEHDAEIKRQLGAMGAEGAPGPDSNKQSPNDYTTANATTTGNDPESESSDTSPVTEAEPGTALSGVSIGDKTAAWRKQAEETLTDLYLVSKEAGLHLEDEAASDVDTGSEYDADNPYLLATGGDVKQANQVRQVVADQLADAYMEGEKLASAVVTYLETLQKTAMDEAAAMPPEAMGGEMPPEMAGGEMPPEMAGGEMPPEMPPEMAGGEMPPEMGGEMGGMEVDPMVLAEALQELAAESGMSIEELIPMLEQAAAGEGGGMPPEAMGDEMAEPKTAMEKLAAVKSRIKKNARAIIEEQMRRGRR